MVLPKSTQTTSIIHRIKKPPQINRITAKTIPKMLLFASDLNNLKRFP